MANETRRHGKSGHEEEDEDSGEFGNNLLLPTPPDGGWGWMVVLGSFMIHVIADGVAYSFGIFYVEFLDYFKEGRGVTGWIASLMIGITWGSGPIASALTNRYGCRKVVIMGSILASLGFIISIFAPNIFFMYFSYGILGGFGLGLIYLPAIVSVTYYFEKRRAFATGLAVCGSGVGTFVFAPLLNLIVHNYGWKGTSLILAGVLLNCAVCGALFRPLEVIDPEERKVRRERELEKGTEIPFEATENGVVANRANGHIPSGNDQAKSRATRSRDKEEAETDSPLGNECASPLIDQEFDIKEIIPPFLSDPTLNHNKVQNSNLRKHASHSDLLDKGATFSKRPSKQAVPPLYRKDIFYYGSLTHLALYRSNPAMYTQSVVGIPSKKPSKDECKLFKWLRCSPEIKNALQEMTDFSLLKNPIFLMFVLSNFLVSVGFCIPYVFLPDVAVQHGIPDDQASLLISIIGVANTLGRVVFGWMSDTRYINRLYLFNTVLTLCGVCTSLCALCITFPWLAAYAAAFGCFLGVYVSLMSVVLVDLMGLDCLTNSFGITLLAAGIGAVIGPPAAGWLYDATGTYTIPFIVMGIITGMSGVILWFIPCVRRWQHRNDPPGSDDNQHSTAVVSSTVVAELT